MKMKFELSVLAAVVLFFISVSFPTVSGAALIDKADKSDQEHILKNYGKLPLYFIENKGQLEPKVKFFVKAPGQTLYFTNEGIVFDLFRQKTKREKTARKGIEESGKNRQPPEETERLVFTLKFDNHRGGIVPEGLDQQSGKVNYFIGNDKSKWKKDIFSYKGILYKEVYKGIDLRLYGTGRNLEYEFIVHPGANPKDITLTYDGIEGIRINEEGELLIGTAFGELREMKPHIYQEINGKRVVDGSFEIKAPVSRLSQSPKYSFGFTVASYDPSHSLVIDPTLVYSTYLGGSSDDAGHGIAVDSSGCAYVIGHTSSTDFPTSAGSFCGSCGEAYDVFVTKFSQSGATLAYSTYLGGNGMDSGYGIAVDSSGNAYVTGNTASTDFPTVSAIQSLSAGDSDAFACKLSPSGTLSYSTYLGGNAEDYGYSIAVDSDGNAYVTGKTYSTDFPTSPGAFCGLNGGESDAFLTKLDSSGSVLIYSTYLGGDNYDSGYGIAVDSSGNAYVTGSTASTDFPVKNAFQSTNNGANDAFVTKFNESGATLVYSTYLGGHISDGGSGIAVDSGGNAYVTGHTYSSSFPVKNAFQPNYKGSKDAFVTKFSPSGSTLVYSTYIGGDSNDGAYGIAVDSGGNAFATGYTLSTDFPTSVGAFCISHGGDLDAFFTKLDSSGTTLAYSTYLGGNSYDECKGIAVDSSGIAYLTGYTESTDFPTKNEYQQDQVGYDAFVIKINSVPVSTLQFSWNMDADPGWTTEGLWAWGQPTGGGGQSCSPDPTGGYTGANVFGYNLSGDYENNLPERNITTGAIDCRGMSEVTLRFRRWLGVEQN